jgi:hypothetical protein
MRESRQKWENRQNYVFRINSDGTFRLDNVVAVTYALDVTLYPITPTPEGGFGNPIAQLRSTLTVPPIPTGRSDEPLDVGTLTVKPVPTSQPAKSASGMLRDAKGQPQRNVVIYIIPPKAGISLTAGRFGAVNIPTVRSKADGSFTIPPQGDDYTLVAGNDVGYGQVAKEQFETDHEITLQPWGTVKGRAMIGSKPAAGANMMLITVTQGTLANERQLSPVLETTTVHADANGDFVFDKVMPGRVSVARMIRIVAPRVAPAAYVEATVQPGQTITLHIGGTGRPVVGQMVVPSFTKPIPWDRVEATLSTQAPVPPFPANWSVMNQQQKNKWFDQWKTTPEAKTYFAREHQYQANRHGYPVAPDKTGHFQIDDVASGDYWLEIYLPDGGGRYRAPIIVPPMPTGRSDQPLDVGKLNLNPSPTSQPTDSIS